MTLFRRRKRPGPHVSAFVLHTGASMSVPVTKFSLRMYGSKKGVEEERVRQKKTGSFVIHPYSNFRFYWDLVSLLLLIASIIIIPVAISFFNEAMTSDPGWIAFNLVLDLWFFSDIGMNFHTGIVVEYGDGDVILDLKEIRRHYLKTWFVIDILSTLPIDYILWMIYGVSPSASASRAMKLFRFARMLSLLRLLRISRLIRYVHQWEEIVNMQYDLAVAAVRIFNLVCVILLIGHWNGCLQYMIPMLYDFPEDSWIVVDNLQNATLGEKYSWSLFKAMSHMLCIGYGQQPPKNMMDLWITMVSMISGAVCFAMFIGHTTALIQSLDSSKRQYKEKYTQVKEYMRYRRLPKALRIKVYEYYENRFQGKMFDEKGILDEVSPALRQEIVNHNCLDLVESVPFFNKADEEFVNEVILLLNYEVYQPNDVIMQEGSVGKKMYFMQHGVVEIKSKQNPKTTQLSDGSYFGEIGLLTNQRRVASVTAVTICALYSLHADDFNELLPRYPVMQHAMEKVAASRLNKLGRCSSVLNRRMKQKDDLNDNSKNIVIEVEKHDQRSAEKVVSPMQANPIGARKFAKFRQANISSPNKKYHAFLRRSRHSAAQDCELMPMSLIDHEGQRRNHGVQQKPNGFFQRMIRRATDWSVNGPIGESSPGSKKHRQRDEYRQLFDPRSCKVIEEVPIHSYHQNGGFDSLEREVITIQEGEGSGQPGVYDLNDSNNLSSEIADVRSDMNRRKGSAQSDSVAVESTDISTGSEISLKERFPASYRSSPLLHAVSLPTLPDTEKSLLQEGKVKSNQILDVASTQIDLENETDLFH